MEQDKCLFYQIHPVVHAGIELDNLDDDLPTYGILGYRTIYKWKHKNKRLQLSIAGAQMSDGYILGVLQTVKVNGLHLEIGLKSNLDILKY